MREIFDASVTVETRRSLRYYPNANIELRLSDYGDSTEFYLACAESYPDEEYPEFIHRFWENIPDSLITKRGLNPAFFEIRDALERLDEDDIDGFLRWCEGNGHDITTDEPLQLVLNYSDQLSTEWESGANLSEMDGGQYYENCLHDGGYDYVLANLMASGRDIFNDNYN